MNLWQRIAYWALAPALSLILYWPGMKTWFREDDFAWLGLGLGVHEPYDMWAALFAPLAQGTIRPWSERLFFLAFHYLFEFDALPFRIFVFMTQFLALWLLQSVTRRLTGSYLAAVAAAILWVFNSSQGVPMSWTSSYNQIQCSAFLLGAFLCLLRYAESGKAKWWWLQCLVFVLGFGSLEINVVYPALASLWLLLYRRDLLLRMIPLFMVSILYASVHRWAAPAEVTAAYKMYWDLDIIKTIGNYVLLAFGSFRFGLGDPWELWASLATVLSAIPLLAFMLQQLRRAQMLVLFLLGWFFIALAPLVPLKLHISDYYLVIPTVGLAIAGGWAIAQSRSAGKTWMAIAAVSAASYLAGSGYMGRRVAIYNYETSITAKKLFLGVEQVAHLHPGKIILLAGVSSEQFWTAIADSPFRLLPGPPEVYITPDAVENIDKHPEIGDVERFAMPDAAARKALDSGAALVYQPVEGKLRNVTPIYQMLASSRWKEGPPDRLNVGQRFLSDFLGAGWHPLENGYRWMAKKASLTISAPPKSTTFLEITCYRQGTDPRPGDLTLTVEANGKIIGKRSISNAEGESTLKYFIQPFPIQEQKTNIVLEIDRSFSYKDDPREFGLVLGTVQWK